MTEYIGAVPIPEIVSSGTFPVVTDYGYGVSREPQVVVHRFGSGDAKIEQRFLLGAGARRFTVRKAAMNETDRQALRDFWENKYGPYGAFTYNAPSDNGKTTTAVTCRFANEPLSWEMLSDQISSVGVTLIEIPTTSPTYSVTSTVTRFPSESLETALLSQVQQLIPLVKIQPRESGYAAIYISDRRCTVGGQLYQARLLEFDGISQGIGGESDEARFICGNADRVMRDLANDTDLFRASLEFSLYHVGTGIKLDLWKGDVISWSMDSGPEFSITAADGMYELTLPYPSRKVCRTCWKKFDDGNGCPFTAEGALDTENYPDADDETCDKGYTTDNGCQAHGMKYYFGGVIAEPQGVRIKDNSTGVWGYGRNQITSTSIVADSIYDQVVPEIYTDDEEFTDKDGNPQSGMPVNCRIAAGREESDFYDALGIVGEGVLTYGTGHTLDGQFQHGYPALTGLRYAQGFDPALSGDDFSLGPSYKDQFSAGIAFLEIRRADDPGIQLSTPGEHTMQAIVMTGITGWVWTGAGSRTEEILTNPVWIVINMILRARGLRYANAATAEQYFDVNAAVAAAAICDTSVQNLINGTYETQFKFRGVVQEEKPLRDWIQEVLMNCLGYYTFANGKLKLGIRINSSAAEAFTEGNILFQSLQLASIRPSFNHLTAHFADREFGFASNSVTVYDMDHAQMVGGSTSPLFLKSDVNLSGTYSKSQAARLVSTRLREELGGITADQWKAARQVSFRTTVLALAVEPGMVCSMTHPDMPDGWLNGDPEPHYGEFRVTGWRLNSDYSIEIQGQSTFDEMYDLTVGPRPADVQADAVPESSQGGTVIPNDCIPETPIEYVSTTKDGISVSEVLVEATAPEDNIPDHVRVYHKLTSEDLTRLRQDCFLEFNADVDEGITGTQAIGMLEPMVIDQNQIIDIFYQSRSRYGLCNQIEMDEDDETTLDGGIDDSVTTVAVADASGLAVDDTIRIDDEYCLITDINTNDLTVVRAQHGSTAASHSSSTTVKLISWTVPHQVMELDGRTDSLAQPTGLTAAGGEGKIVLHWNAYSAISSRLLKHFKVLRGTNPASLSEIAICDANYYIDSLDRDDTDLYYYAVVGVDTSGNESTQSDTANARQTADTGVPTGVSVSAIGESDGAGHLVVTWGVDNPTGNNAGIITTKIQIATDSLFNNIVYEGVFGTCPVSGVWTTSLFVEYYLRAYCENAFGWSDASSTFVVGENLTYPTQDTAVPGAPANFTFVAKDEDPALSGLELVAEWNPPTSQVNSLFRYILQVHTSDSFPTHTVSVSARTSGVFTIGSYSLTDTGQDFTGLTGKVVFVYVDGTDDAHLVWSSPIRSVDGDTLETFDDFRYASTMTGHTVYYAIVVPDWEQCRTYNVDTWILGGGSIGQSLFRQVIAQLAPDTYYARVRGVNKIGMGSWSSTLNATIEGGAFAPVDTVIPGVPTNVTVVVRGTKFIGDWDAPTTGYNSLDDVCIQYATDAGFTTGVVTCIGWGRIFHAEGEAPNCTYYHRFAWHNQSGEASNSTVHDAIVAAGYPHSLADYGWGPFCTSPGSRTTGAQADTTLSAAMQAKTTTFRQASAPTAQNTGDLWYDSDDNNKLYRWAGSWVQVTLIADYVVANISITSPTITGGTIQTAASGTRVVMASNKITAYSGSTPVVTIDGAQGDGAYIWASNMLTAHLSVAGGGDSVEIYPTYLSVLDGVITAASITQTYISSNGYISAAGYVAGASFKVGAVEIVSSSRVGALAGLNVTGDADVTGDLTGGYIASDDWVQAKRFNASGSGAEGYKITGSVAIDMDRNFYAYSSISIGSTSLNESQLQAIKTHCGV